MPFPSSQTDFPVQLANGTRHAGTVFLRAILDHSRIEAGDYSYASSHDPFVDGADVASRLAPYLYAFSPERLFIGKFCQIAHGVEFITASANHRYDGLSSFPFMVFGAEDRASRPSMPAPGADTVIGNDVWIGTRAMILPGAQIGDGAIIGAGAVVSGVVPPYTIFAGNPARLVRKRFSGDVVRRMQALAWWDWPIEMILANEALICGGDVAKLELAAP